MLLSALLIINYFLPTLSFYAYGSSIVFSVSFYNFFFLITPLLNLVNTPYLRLNVFSIQHVIFFIYVFLLNFCITTFNTKYFLNVFIVLSNLLGLYWAYNLFSIIWLNDAIELLGLSFLVVLLLNSHTSSNINLIITVFVLFKLYYLNFFYSQHSFVSPNLINNVYSGRFSSFTYKCLKLNNNYAYCSCLYILTNLIIFILPIKFISYNYIFSDMTIFQISLLVYFYLYVCLLINSCVFIFVVCIVFLKLHTFYVIIGNNVVHYCT